MAKTFKNQKELESFLMKQSRQALLKAQDKIYGIIKKFLYGYYTEFSPDEYKRTRQFLESLVMSQIVSDGKGYKVEIYFDVSGMNYTTGSWSGEEVLDVAMNYQYPHGAYEDAGGKPIWKPTLAKLDAKAINILVDMLRAEGVVVKKG